MVRIHFPPGKSLRTIGSWVPTLANAGGGGRANRSAPSSAATSPALPSGREHDAARSREEDSLAYASQGKAVASAAFGRPSGEMAERADQPTPRGVAAAEGGHMIMGQGAVPIIRNGVVEGACGVSGGTAQQDEDCARAGVAQL